MNWSASAGKPKGPGSASRCELKMTNRVVVAVTAGQVPPAAVFVTAVVVAGLAICGWLCIYKTDALVEQQRRRYEKHGWIRAYPFSGMVMKSWYPTYLRCSGIFVWLWDLVLIYLLWVRKPVR
jgi:hypothetical protein